MTLDEAVTAASAKLSDSAFEYARDKSQAHWSLLCQSAEAFAKARWAAKAPAPAKSSGFVVPFGKSKGTPLSEADKKDLLYLSRVLPESIADETKAKWAEKNRELLSAVEAELATR